MTYGTYSVGTVTSTYSKKKKKKKKITYQKICWAHDRVYTTSML